MTKKPNPKSKIFRLKSRRDLKEKIDFDYLDKLTHEEQEFLANFSDDFYRGKGSNAWKSRNDSYNEFKTQITPETLTDDLDPEKILLIKELKTSRKG